MNTKNTPKIITKGVCSFCKSEFDRSKITQHVRNCKERKAILASLSTDETKQKKRLFHIQAEGRYNPQYWMNLEIPAEATLDDLDDFLRAMWFENGEHLSGFKIDDTSYSSEEDDEDDLFGDGPDIYGEESDEEEEDDDDEANEVEDVAKDEAEGDDEGDEEEGDEDEDDYYIDGDYVDGEKLVAALPEFYHPFLPPDFVTDLKQEWFLYDLLPFLKENQKIVHHEMIKAFNEKRIDEARVVYTLDNAITVMIKMVEDTSTEVQLQYVLKVEKKFYFIYDYGTSTYVKLRVVSEREDIIRDEEEPVELLALNVLPEISCVVCGKPATQVVSGYYYDFMEHAYCDECAKNLDEDETYNLIEIENSPRVGVDE